MPKTNTNKKLSPKFDYQLINKETDDSSGDLGEYLLKGKEKPREK